jgi:hypothetical protein
MTTTPHQSNEIHSAAARRRQLRVMQVIFAGAATVAMFVLFDAARPDTTDAEVGSGSVRLTDIATDLPAPASGPVGLQFPQTPPNLADGGGFAADDSSDQAQQQAQQEEQQALQQMDQEQNDLAEQQFTQDELQAQMDEQQANDP